MKPYRFLWAGPVVVTAALMAILLPSDVGAQLNFNPELQITLSDASPGAQADITTDFNVEAPDATFDAVISFQPIDFTTPTSDRAPIGAVVGQVTSTSTVGISNQPCSTTIDVPFDLINASVDNTDVLPDEPALPDPDWPGFADSDGNGLQDAIDKYPAFLNTLFPNLAPVSRSIGFAEVAGMRVVLQFLTFPPGSEFPVTAPGHPPFDPALGRPSVTISQDPTQPPATGLLTDLCTPIRSSNTSFAVSKDNPDTAAVDEGGIVRLINPAAGSYTFTTWVRSLRDADDDGIENELDTCATIPNEGDPREKGSGDADEDGLDAACDPNDNDTNSDEDDDGLFNREDNCPLDPNPEGEDSDSDGIGDVCDPDPTTASGDNVELFVEAEVAVAAAAATPTPAPTPIPPPEEEDGFPLWAGLVVGLGGAALLIVVAGATAYALRRP